MAKQNSNFPEDAVCLELAGGGLVDLKNSDARGARVVVQTEAAGREVVRHSTAHVLAQAVLSLWPDAKYAIGPPIESGFFYDFDIGRPFTPDDLERIEDNMKNIVLSDQPFVREEVSLDAAAKIFQGQPYKLEIIEGIGDDSYDQGVTADTVSIYRNDGVFVDLCRGPHVPSTGHIRAFKLLRSSGAYWRGDEKRQMLQRIHGTAWESQEALADYMHRLEEAERRDHVKIGRQMELFMTHDWLPSGFPIWLGKGATIRRLLEEYILGEERRAGYVHVVTPHFGRKELFEASGHLEFFTENMYPPLVLEHEELVLKPVNCPHHILVFGSKLRSYRELPLRFAELGAMYRYERSGVVRGLSRVRYMTLNDAHIFCTREQIEEEFAAVMGMVESVYRDLGITEYGYRLSLRDPDDKEKYFPDDDLWDQAEDALREVLQALGLEFVEALGEAAFYGPKLDIQLFDILRREETYSTIQLDFLLPQRFELTYIGDDGEEHRPVMIHRAIISTLERIVAYLVELYGGAFPTWLAPVQVNIIPIAERHNNYAGVLRDELEKSELRVEIDDSDETLNNRIRKAQLLKVPYMLIVGDKESEGGTVSVRPRSGDEMRGVPLADFVRRITDEIAKKGSPESI